jgi:hypothetical protein
VLGIRQDECGEEESEGESGIWRGSKKLLIVCSTTISAASAA